MESILNRYITNPDPLRLSEVREHLRGLLKDYPNDVNVLGTAADFLPPRCRLPLLLRGFRLAKDSGDSLNTVFIASDLAWEYVRQSRSPEARRFLGELETQLEQANIEYSEIEHKYLRAAISKLEASSSQNQHSSKR